MIVRNNWDIARNLIVKKLKPKEKRIQTTRLAKNQQLNYNKQRFGKKKTNKERNLLTQPFSDLKRISFPILLREFHNSLLP